MKFKYLISLILILITIVLLATFFWLKGVGADFMQNLITEAIGIFITVIIIDFILRKNEEEKKRKISDIALIQCMRMADKILSLFYPSENGHSIITQYTFGTHEIITHNNSFTNGTEFELSLSNKNLFVERIKSEVEDPTFVDYNSTKLYLIEKNEAILELNYMFQHVINSLQYSDNYELYSLISNLQMNIMQYFDMRDMKAGHKIIADLIAEFEIPMVNVAIKIHFVIANRANKREELLRFPNS